KMSRMVDRPSRLSVKAARMPSSSRSRTHWGSSAVHVCAGRVPSGHNKLNGGTPVTPVVFRRQTTGDADTYVPVHVSQGAPRQTGGAISCTQYLGANPTARGDVDHLIIGAPVLNLIIGTGVRTRRVPQVDPPHGGLGARLLQLFAGLVYIIHQETEVVDAGVPGHVPGTLTAALLIGLENSQINVPIGEVVAGPGPAHLLQTEHLFVKGGSLLRVWGAYGDVFDLCHNDLPYAIR